MPLHAAIPSLGFGLGLRPAHYRAVFEGDPKVDWFEIISENFMDTDGRPRRHLARIRERYPVAMHGVGLSIGTVDPLHSEYLRKLKSLVDWLNPVLISDHLCWTGVAHRNTHDLLPVPYTEEALAHIVSRIRQVQEVLGRPIAFENPSTYLEFQSSHIPEAEFLARMVEASGCLLLLDVNNVFVTCTNHRIDPKRYMDMLPLDRVAQIHLSGHRNHGTHIVDTHDDHVVDEVWALYRYVIARAGRVPNTMVEWDDNIPDFLVLLAELDKARNAAADRDSPIVLPQIAEAAFLATQTEALDAQQRRMQTAIQTGENGIPDAWIRGSGTFDAAARLGIYIHAYRSRLFEATAEDYPALAHYLGKTRFEAVIDDFITATASDHFNLSRYAAKLPEFVAQRTEIDLFAQALCTLEAAIAHLADLEETMPLSPKHLAGMTPEDLMQSVLHPRTALALFAFDHPVNAYYTALMQEKPIEKPESAPGFLAVFRHEDAVWRMDLGAAEYRMLTLLFSGLPVGDALEQMQDDADIALELSGWFARWMRNGLLAFSPPRARIGQAA